MAALYCQRVGQGPELVLLHGWGLHGGVWRAVTPRLAERFCVTAVDLPGHGRSRGSAVPQTLDAWARELAQLPQAGPAVWVGWSLGALAALQTALRYPERIARLVLVSATPKFVRAPGWNCAIETAVLHQFAADLDRDYQATLRRFLSLQFGPTAAERAMVRELRTELRRRGEPHAAALRAGLHIFEETDLRAAAAGLRVPALLIHGRRDRLVPVGAAEYLRSCLPDARLEVIDAAGHAPFLSHLREFLSALEGFLDD